MKNLKAFTLIEISVVLVIISVIMGCIYRGNEMLAQAKLKSVIKDLYKYQTAFNLFKTQYNALPGDFINATTAWPNGNTANGNGNGYIETASGIGLPLEDSYVYQHLYLGGMLAEAFSGGLQSGVRKSTAKGGNLPAAKYANGSFEILTQTLYARTATYLEFGSLTKSNNPLADGAILTPGDCNYIDKKIDDGLASSGFIFGGNAASITGCAANFTASSGTYLLTSEELSCRLAMFLSETN